MHIVVLQRLADIAPKQWNCLNTDGNPFLQHEFLNGLEKTQCVVAENGWHPQHLALFEGETLLAAMPCYIKDHSYGEYIFDWAWVNAYHRHGIEYYPKLSNAVPFTPATGQRILISDAAQQHGLSDDRAFELFITKIQEMSEEQGLSSFHSLFNTSRQAEQFKSLGLLKRHSTQFHWRNDNYQDFDDFLSRMSSKKRKNIKRERRRVAETGITYRWLEGPLLTAQTAQTMYGFYSRTISYYGAKSYLNRDFFQHLVSDFSHQTLFLFAEFEGTTIAGGLYFKSDHTLYGRYWGALNNFHSVHFETCYYQAIEWCIKNKYRKFEAGAQGEHKLARGLEPCSTYSSHWIAHPEFSDAIASFVESEESHIEEYKRSLEHHSPFKSEC
ncbi:GNAT family N-acetyltransferase [Arenicella sp. 4NH20-0111]|uniref:GNAT family N-acetyltransferase n=1 Tax=Arenicella sp. 4NH20-0111 TaxID=3127648 RepID=UPI00310C1A08